MIYRRSKALGPSRARLDTLVRQRLRPGSDHAAIDREIWSRFGGNWCAMFTDLSGFSRRVADFGIIHFLQTIYVSECLLTPVIEEHRGTILKFEGDSFLIAFPAVPPAVRAAVAMQRMARLYNDDQPPENKILLCVGLGYGPMLRLEDGDIFGLEVNKASKLGEDMARPGEILVTGSVREKAARIRGLRFTPIRREHKWIGPAYRMDYEKA